MADLVTRLLLNSSLFDNSIRQSTQQVKSFLKMGDQLKGTITKFAGVLGVAVSASEVFTAAINSNSITLNRWNDVLGTTKESVDSFFTSLTTGDWSVFEGGIINAIKLSKQYTLALRDIDNNLKIGDVHLSQDEKELNRLENIASDESQSKETREKAFADLKKKGKETVEYMNGLSKNINDNLTEMLEGKGIKADKSVRDMIFNYLDTSTAGGKELERYAKIRKDLKDTDKNSDDANSMEGGVGVVLAKKLEKDITALKDTKKRMEKLNPQLAEAYKLKISFNEEEVGELLDYTTKLIGLEDRLESAKKQVTDLSKDFDKNGKLKPKDKKKTTVAKEKSQVITTGDYLTIPMVIPELTLADLEAEKKGIINRMNHSNQQDYIKLKVKLEKKEQEIEDFKNGKGGMLIKGLDVSKAIPLLFDNIEDNINDSVSSATDNIAMMSSALGSLQSAMLATGQSSEKMAKSMATANAAASIAMLIATMVEKTKTSVTIWDWIAGATAGVATVITLAAQLKSVSKFANGGIVGGNSTIGDMNLARVNAGEMILNNHQLRNLFNLLNNGGASSVATSGTVEFKIEGKQLVGVLNNYNHKVSKVR